VIANEGLSIFLYSWLARLQPEEKTQRTLVISWLIELIVYDLNLVMEVACGDDERHKAKQDEEKQKAKLKQKQG
jgi:hypothetical protein